MPDEVTIELVGGPLDGVTEQAPADEDGPTVLVSGILQLIEYGSPAGGRWHVFYYRDPDPRPDGVWTYRFFREYRETA